MRVLLMGPPGAGKGTQAALLGERLGVPHIATGDIFRTNVATGTDLGRQAQSYMDAGEYVPDEVTDAMVRDRLGQPDAAEGFLLDGYPRTAAQVGTLDTILTDAGTSLDTVVVLEVDRDVVIDRLVERSRTEGRADDTADVVAHRQDVYVEQTGPLVAIYDHRSLVRRVDGIGSVDDVAARIDAALTVSR